MKMFMAFVYGLVILKTSCAEPGVTSTTELDLSFFDEGFQTSKPPIVDTSASVAPSQGSRPVPGGGGNAISNDAFLQSILSSIAASKPGQTAPLTPANDGLSFGNRGLSSAPISSIPSNTLSSSYPNFLPPSSSNVMFSSGVRPYNPFPLKSGSQAPAMSAVYEPYNRGVSSNQAVPFSNTFYSPLKSFVQHPSQTKKPAAQVSQPFKRVASFQLPGHVISAPDISYSVKTNPLSSSYSIPQAPVAFASPSFGTGRIVASFVRSYVRPDPLVPLGQIAPPMPAMSTMTSGYVPSSSLSTEDIVSTIANSYISSPSMVPSVPYVSSAPFISSYSYISPQTSGQPVANNIASILRYTSPSSVKSSAPLQSAAPIANQVNSIGATPMFSTYSNTGATTGNEWPLNYNYPPKTTIISYSTYDAPGVHYG